MEGKTQDRKPNGKSEVYDRETVLTLVMSGQISMLAGIL